MSTNLCSTSSLVHDTAVSLQNALIERTRYYSVHRLGPIIVSRNSVSIICHVNDHSKSNSNASFVWSPAAASSPLLTEQPPILSRSFFYWGPRTHVFRPSFAKGSCHKENTHVAFDTPSAFRQTGWESSRQMGSRLNAQDQRKGPHYCLAEMYDLNNTSVLFIPVLGPSLSTRLDCQPWQLWGAAVTVYIAVHWSWWRCVVELGWIGLCIASVGTVVDVACFIQGSNNTETSGSEHRTG